MTAGAAGALAVAIAGEALDASEAPAMAAGGSYWEVAWIPSNPGIDANYSNSDTSSELPSIERLACLSLKDV